MQFAHTQIPLIVAARNDLLTDDQGRVYTDLFSGNGACWLGHGRAEVNAALQRASEGAWLLGGLRHDGLPRVTEAIQPFLPAGLSLAALASTGMEVTELCMRVARVATGRSGMLGFAGNMHGKSLAASYLGWDNHDGVDLPGWHRVPFVDRQAEEAVLDDVQSALQCGNVGAVFVEVMQGSNGAREGSTGFYQALQAMVHAQGALLVCDEILTGFHRARYRYRFERHGLAPDIVLIGKACGNGFPVAGLLLRTGLALEPRMLPGSTFSGNPLACAVMAQALSLMSTLDVGGRSAAVGAVVKAHFDQLPPGWVLRGDGALWILDCLTPESARAVMERCYLRGVSVGGYGRWLRIMPAATIDIDRLASACAVIAKAALEVGHG